VNPLPTGNPVTALTWDGNQFIGFDTSDAVLTSADGISWSSVPTGLQAGIGSLVWGNGLYVAVGGSFSGFIATSTDGVTWTGQNSGVPVSRFSQVLWNADLQQYVVIADSGVILTSANGTDWLPQGSGTINDLNGIVWSHGKYVVVGANGTVLTSSDGVDWADHSIANSAEPLLSVTASDTLFAVVQGSLDSNVQTEILTNTDPTRPLKWELTFAVVDPTTDSHLSRIVWDGTNFVALGGIVATSADGAVWTYVAPGVRGILDPVAFNAQQIIAADFSGDIAVSALDGLIWTPSSSNIINEHLTNVIWNGSEFASVSDFGSFLSSDNGLDWNVNNFAMPLSATALAWHADTFVAVGEGGIASSTNGGLSWDPSSSTGLNQTRFRSVAWGAGKFVAVGTIDVGNPPLALPQGVVYTSTDGVAWTAQASSALLGDSFISVIWAGNEFLAVGASVAHSADGDLVLLPPPVFTSADGSAWTRYSPLTSVIGGTALVSVAWSGSRFVAVGTPGFLFDQRSVATSADGVNWDYVNPLPDPPFDAGALEAVTWTGNHFVAVGASTSELTSPDGLVWTAHTTGASDLSSVATDGLQCIAVGDAGTIMREPSLCNNNAIFESGFE